MHQFKDSIFTQYIEVAPLELSHGLINRWNRHGIAKHCCGPLICWSGLRDSSTRAGGWQLMEFTSQRGSTASPRVSCAHFCSSAPVILTWCFPSCAPVILTWGHWYSKPTAHRHPQTYPSMTITTLLHIEPLEPPGQDWCLFGALGFTLNPADRPTVVQYEKGPL